MCAIVGALLTNVTKTGDKEWVDYVLKHIMERSRARGRDGYGWDAHFQTMNTGWDESVKMAGKFDEIVVPSLLKHSDDIDVFNMVCNFRAEPTTEYVENKREEDQQPYRLDGWSVVHNGTIANDKELRTNRLPTCIDSAAIVEYVATQRELFNDMYSSYGSFRTALINVTGSFATLAKRDGLASCLFAGVNYRPLWYVQTKFGFFFASSKEYFPPGLHAEPLEPYTTALFSVRAGVPIIDKAELPREEKEGRPRALVVASGGLDSTVAAAKCKDLGLDVDLVHFRYGCRAEKKEEDAISAIGDALGANVRFLDLDIYDPKSSRLFDKESEFAGGEAGAEFAHEWVPARNLVMLSVATAYAEANDYDYLVLGNNMEEAGAYPDNEPEFIRRFNELLPFAVGANKHLKVLMPVGDLMKHEIVALGHEVDAPMHLTWSCYRNGKKHCGKCGPCFMRRTAFDINGLAEVIAYEDE